MFKLLFKHFEVRRHRAVHVRLFLLNDGAAARGVRLRKFPGRHLKKARDVLHREIAPLDELQIG